MVKSSKVKVIGFIDLMKSESSVSKGAKKFLKELKHDEEEYQQREAEEEWYKIQMSNYFNL